MPSIDSHKAGRFMLYGSLLLVLFIDGVAFLGTAIWDMWLFSRDQVLSALLRVVIGPLNLAALVAVARKKYKPWLLGQSAIPPSLPHPAGLKSPFANPLVLFTQAASIPLIFMPIWIECRSPSHGRWDVTALVVAIALFVYGAILIAFSFIRGTVSFGWVAFGSLLPLLGVAQFLYLNFYLPTHNRPSVDLSVKLDKVGHSKNITHMRGVVTVKNRGSATVGVLGSMYAVAGYWNKGSLGSMPPKDALDANRVDTHHPDKFASLLRVDDILPAGKDLSEDENWSTSFVFDVRDSQQNLVRLTAYLSLVTHEGPLESITCTMGPSSGSCDIPFHGRSVARQYLGDDPHANTYMEYGSKEPPYIATNFIAQGEEKDFAEAVDFLTRNQFTQSIVEYQLDP